MASRIAWVDAVKGICVFSVILMHVEKPIIYSKVCVPFFLCAFFFVSGYCFDYRKIYKTTIKTFQYFLLYSLLNQVIRWVLLNGEFNSRFLIGMFLQVPTSPKYPEATLWFLPCMIMSKLIFAINMYLYEKKAWMGYASCLGCCLTGGIYIYYVRSCLPWHIQTAMLVQGMLLLGFLFKKHEKKIKEFESLLFPCITSAYFFTVFTFPIDADLCTLFFTDFSMYCLQAVLGTCFIVLLMRKAAEKLLYIFIYWEKLNVLLCV